jgi:hypothetical protein
VASEAEEVEYRQRRRERLERTLTRWRAAGWTGDADAVHRDDERRADGQTEHYRGCRARLAAAGGPLTADERVQNGW